MLQLRSFRLGGSPGGSFARARSICCEWMLTQSGSRPTRMGLARMNGLAGMCGDKVVAGVAAALLFLALAGSAPALAETMESALVRAYQDNPQLNAQRAQVRATDEGVPQAL